MAITYLLPTNGCPATEGPCDKSFSMWGYFDATWYWQAGSGKLPNIIPMMSNDGLGESWQGHDDKQQNSDCPITAASTCPQPETRQRKCSGTKVSKVTQTGTRGHPEHIRSGQRVMKQKRLTSSRLHHR